jgi:hypothetical protein
MAKGWFWAAGCWTDTKKTGVAEGKVAIIRRHHTLADGTLAKQGPATRF